MMKIFKVVNFMSQSLYSIDLKIIQHSNCLFLCFVVEYVTVEPFEEDLQNSVDNGAR